MISPVTDALAEDAAGCTVMVHAALLAGWVGAGRAVTPRGVLRPVDVPSAAEVLGVAVPKRIRTAADVPVIHHPWVAAQAIGLLSVDDGRARMTSAPVEDQLPAWWTALLAVLEEESGDRQSEGATVLCRTLLTALAGEPPPPHDRLDEIVHDLLHHEELVRRPPCTKRSGAVSCRSTAGLRSWGSSAPSMPWGG